ncbi:MAG TPA: hypothetical protein VG389_12615, partial [Myxococcota bacterium]|nr:hypothetical protein [Myxococcota bacterium]
PSAHDYLAAGGDLETPFGTGEGFLGFDALDSDARFVKFIAPPEGSAPGTAAVAATDEADAAKGEAGPPKERLEALEHAAAENVFELASRTTAGAGAGAMARGVLPVKFVLPERGVLVPFTTALVLPGEAPSVYVRYGPSWVRAAASMTGAGAVMAGLLLVAAALLRARRRRSLNGADVRLWAGVATIFVACAVVLLAGGTLLPVGFAGFGLAVAYGALRWLVERRGRAAATAPAAAAATPTPTPTPAAPPAATT